MISLPTPKINPVPGGINKVYSFDNGLQLSVSQSNLTYGGDRGLWEVALLDSSGEFCGQKLMPDLFEYDDVVGWLTESKVDELLHTVKAVKMK